LQILIAPDQFSMARLSIIIAVLGLAAGAAVHDPLGDQAYFRELRENVTSNPVFQKKISAVCSSAAPDKMSECQSKSADSMFCKLLQRARPNMNARKSGNCFQDLSSVEKLPALVQTSSLRKTSAPEDELASEMTHDLEMNFNKIAPFGKEDTAKELQDHAAKTQDTLVDAVENAEVAEIKRAVFRALTRLRAATIKEFDTIARLETQAIDAYNDAHHYRGENPLAHLHEDEAPVETDKLKSFH